MTCHVDGREYIEGQKIYPDAAPCHKCICGENYDNSTAVSANPHCQEFSCNIDLLQKSRLSRACVPIIHKGSCCPFEWHCREYQIPVFVNRNRAKNRLNLSASDHDEVNKLGPTGDRSAPGSECKFGALTLNLGDELKTDQSCMKCTCSIPPIVSCVKDGYC